MAASSFGGWSRCIVEVLQGIDRRSSELLSAGVRGAGVELRLSRSVQGASHYHCWFIRFNSRFVVEIFPAL